MGLDDLSPEHRARIEAFKRNHGFRWKHWLWTFWMDGTDESKPDGHLLRQIRNEHGPEWLNKCPSGYNPPNIGSNRT